MILQLVLQSSAIRRVVRHELAESPLIFGAGILLEERGRDKRLQIPNTTTLLSLELLVILQRSGTWEENGTNLDDKQTSEVDAVDEVGAPCPGRVEGWRP